VRAARLLAVVVVAAVSLGAGKKKPAPPEAKSSDLAVVSPASVELDAHEGTLQPLEAATA